MLQLRKSISLESLQLPFKNALERAASIGAEGIELNARTTLKPQDLSRTGVRQIRKWLGDYNLVVSCISYPTRRGLHDENQLERRLEGIKSAMKMAGELGCSVVSNNLVSRSLSEGDPEWSTLLTTVQDLANFSFKAGVWLAARTGKLNSEPLQQLLCSLPNGSIQIDFDPAELLIYQQSPVETMKNAASHVSHFRARDAVRDLSGGPTLPVQIGRGTVDFHELFGLLEEHHYRGFVTVEQSSRERYTSECEQAFSYLDELFR
ncbi:MAG: sugar phosphate isomerase/epimerase [Pirellulaceae bacterium]